VEEGKHKEVAVEMLFENLEEVVSSSSSAFTEKLEKMKKMKMSTYTPVATFKPKTDLRRRRPCEEEEAEKSKKKAKRTSADDLALSEEEEEDFSEHDPMVETGLVVPDLPLPVAFPPFVSADC
jgi:ElaB/YqjD/DUF883 family membrane-anchored ribosome-binding protein